MYQVKTVYNRRLAKSKVSVKKVVQKSDPEYVFHSFNDEYNEYFENIKEADRHAENLRRHNEY